jgi:hypothetical protein
MPRTKALINHNGMVLNVTAISALDRLLWKWIPFGDHSHKLKRIVAGKTISVFTAEHQVIERLIAENDLFHRKLASLLLQSMKLRTKQKGHPSRWAGLHAAGVESHKTKAK